MQSAELRLPEHCTLVSAPGATDRARFEREANDALRRNVPKYTGGMAASQRSRGVKGKRRLSQLLAALPAKPGLALVVVQHLAPQQDGVLMLGRAESVGSYPDLFAAAEKHHRLYAPRLLDVLPLAALPQRRVGPSAEPFGAPGTAGVAE